MPPRNVFHQKRLRDFSSNRCFPELIIESSLFFPDTSRVPFDPSDIMPESAKEVALGQMQKRCRQRCNDATTIRQPTAMTASLATKLYAKRAEPRSRNPTDGFPKDSACENLIAPLHGRQRFSFCTGGGRGELTDCPKVPRARRRKKATGVLFRSLLYGASKIKRQLSLATNIKNENRNQKSEKKQNKKTKTEK